MAKADLAETLGAALAAPGGASSDFDLNPEHLRPKNLALRPAAVLVAVVDLPAGPSVLLTKRSSALRHHPGQVACPGGKVDPEDPSFEAAALREAEEEVGLDPERVEVIGRLDPHATVTGFEVTPILGLVRGEIETILETGEVEEAFFAPFDHLMDPSRYRIEGRMWQGHLRRYYAVPWGPYYIWGATARILRRLADRMEQ
ncbi:MAG: CoA pyrophosphatase [Pseudomonadota bacterium]